METKKYQLMTGTDDFRKLISSDMLTVDPEYIFVDKTLFIKKFLESGVEVLLITRPRRWGKTLALSMLRYFLEAEVDGVPTAGLFKNLKIAEYLQEGSKLKKVQGQYPVILISFKDLKGESFEEIRENITKEIAILFKSFSYLEDELRKQNSRFGSASTCTEDLKIFAQIKNKEADNSDLKRALKFLSELLYKYHGKKVFILIDEYDNVINNNFEDPALAGQLTNFFEGLFSSGLKTNPYLEKGLVTGVLRIAKAGMFSGFNNPTEFTVLDDMFAEHYGFTEEEAFELLSNAGLANFEEVRRWYNGYLVGQQRMYNPWSITQLIKKNGKLDAYWVDTARPGMMKNILVDNSKSTQRVKIGDLLRHQVLELPNELSRSISMEDMINNPGALWSLMLHSGYLTLAKANNLKNVRLPNYEVEQIIEKYVGNWFTANSLFSDAANALLVPDLETFREALEDALQDPAYSARIMSGGGRAARDPGVISVKEFMYQFLVMAELRCINSGTTDYEVIAEPQAISNGQTRPDFIVVHHVHKFCIVGEIKTTSRNETLEAAAARAIAQIEKNQYGAKYEHDGYRLIKVGMAFQGLEFEIMWEE